MKSADNIGAMPDMILETQKEANANSMVLIFGKKQSDSYFEHDYEYEHDMCAHQYVSIAIPIRNKIR